MKPLALWSSSYKQIARQETIIKMAKKLLDISFIPANFQYWTLAGLYGDKEGNPIKGEFHQLEQEGFITKEQFHGVDRNKEIIEKNRQWYPELNWHCGSFLTEMKKYDGLYEFKPYIVNFDSTSELEKGCKQLRYILEFLEDKACKMVIGNLMLNSPYDMDREIHNGQHIIDMIGDIYNYKKHWNLYEYRYEYEGSGEKSRTKLASVIFWRK